MDDRLWSEILKDFDEQAGEPPAAQPEGWELCLLARTASQRLGCAKSLAKKIEGLLLAEGPSLDGCRELLRQGLAPVIAPVEEARELVSRSMISRSRSPRRRQCLQQAHAILRKADIAWKRHARAADVATTLLAAGRALPPAVSAVQAVVQSLEGGIAENFLQLCGRMLPFQKPCI